jgi:hypothetical protein
VSRSSRPPRDAETITAERVAAHRQRCLVAIAAALAEYGFADVPESIRVAVNRLAWDAVREGQHYAYLRRTVRQDPPDPDRAPTPVDRDATTRRRGR